MRQKSHLVVLGSS